MMRRASWTAAAATAAVLTLAPAAVAGTSSPPGDAPAATGTSAATRTPVDLARTETGWVRGTVDDDVVRFSGIPYAAPPVGELRFRAPRAPQAWSGVRDASEHGPVCPQLEYRPGDPGEPWTGVLVGAEDCLSLDVVRPAPRRPAAEARGHGEDGLPVVVWLHGGYLNTGAGSEYDGARLAVGGDVVVVTVNHRLSALGYLSHPALDEPGLTSGNTGYADQVRALEWVRDNVAAFGGDPRRVTLAGQSTGARSVCTHLAAPGSRGLFQRAVVQSGNCADLVATLPQARTRGEQAVEEAGCGQATDVARCLRRAPVEDLVGLLAEVGGNPLGDRADDPWGPVAGTRFLPEQPAEAIAGGRSARVPLLIGATRHEGRGLVLGRMPGLTEQNYRAAVTQAMGADAATVLAAYPASAFPSPAYALSAVATDRGYVCPTMTTVRDAAGHMPVYAYELTEESTPSDGLAYGAFHGWDLPFLWDLDQHYDGYPDLTSEQHRLSTWMIDHWTAFARTGRPAATGQPAWPRATPATRTTLGLAVDDIRSVPTADDHRCDLWAHVTGQDGNP